jgi:hypothetical protein
MLGGPAIFGSPLVLLLMIASVARHPASLGSGLFIADIVLLSAYGAFSVWVWCQSRPERNVALTAGARTGLILGAVLIASHAIEWLAPVENKVVQVARGAGSVLLMLGLLGASGSAAWQRTRSFRWAVIAGLWCGSVAGLMLLSFAFTLNLAFEAHAESWLHQAFLASGMTDPGAFVVRNSLESASEILLRLPLAALALALTGSLANAWIMRRRSLALIAAWFAPFIFVAGAAALWYADSLNREARPPFVLAGVLAAGVAVCLAHPIWSSLARTSRS